MSTLPGLASKGEKGKSKFQSLDINTLYKVYTGEPSETQTQKNTLPRKHGMQSLGKVPTARRPPANLPSLKSEHTGSDAAVSLVPSGGAGWGKQDGNSSSTASPPTTSTVTSSNVSTPSPANVQLNTHQAVSALPVPTPIPPPNKHHVPPIATPVTADKSWSAVMSGTDLLQPPPYQSPQFQHEFPSLSAGDGAPPRAGADTQYGPGPSLRPQTEGSWIQGGSRAPNEGPPRSNSAPLAAPPQLSAQVGPPPQQPMPPQFRAVMPQFMYRGNFTPNGHGGPNFPNMPGSMNGRNRVPDNRPPNRAAESEEMLHRPIIKEEELNRMDDMTRDVGWATHDDIDYNQKLAFSDDEADHEKVVRQSSHSKDHNKTEHTFQEAPAKNWGANRPGPNTQPLGPQAPRARTSEEDEVWTHRRRQHSEKVAMVVERAKQRKEEEEKRFLETKQAAAKKLQELEEKLIRNKRDKEQEDSQGTINPSSVPPQPITPVPIPVPDWERDKEVQGHVSVENTNNKSRQREAGSDFRKLAQIEGRNLVRKDSRSVDRDPRERERDTRDQNGPSFSKQFQSNLPPRFQKQQQLRNNTNSSPQPPGSSVPFADQYEMSWQQNQSYAKGPSNNSRKPRQEFEEIDNKDREDDRKDNRRHDDGYRGPYRSENAYPIQDTKYSDEVHDHRNQDYDYKREEEKWEREKEKKNVAHDLFGEHGMNRHNSDEWRRDAYDREEKVHERYERPQRPDSRDSRASRESRHSRESTKDSESRDYHGSWADAPFEPMYEEKRKDFRGDRRQVPGPITKDRIEAEDLKSEKKNLTELKRGGYLLEKSNIEVKNEQSIDKEMDFGSITPAENAKTWADAISPNTVAPENPKFMDALEKTGKVNTGEVVGEEAKDGGKDTKRTDQTVNDNKEKEDKRGHMSNRRRGGDSRWGAAFVYRSTNWTKKSDPRRSSRPGTVKKMPSGKTGDWHNTDSEGSVEEVSVSTESGKDDRSMRTSQRSPKLHRKFDKDERNKEVKQDKPSSSDRKSDSHRRENYVPRGEPSRHGRGAGNFRSRGGLSKRIDGHYGPPPSKSPFGQHEDKDRKASSEEAVAEGLSSDEKSKHNQEALSAGIIGSRNNNKDFGFTKQRNDDKFSKNKNISDIRQSKVKGKNENEDNCDTSDNSDESGLKDGKVPQRFAKSPNTVGGGNRNASSGSSATLPRRNPPPRFAHDKRSGYSCRPEQNMRQNSSGSLRGIAKREIIVRIEDCKLFGYNVAPNPTTDKSKNKEVVEDAESPEVEGDDKTKCDSDGFQEVKSKKAVQRQKPADEKLVAKPMPKVDKDVKVERKKPTGPATQLTPQQIANIPSLMDTPVNPPAIVAQPSNKGQYDRSRQHKLPPRFAKQRENNRLQKVHMQQGVCDVNDMNKVNHSMNMYGLKEGPSVVAGPISNAWEKPLAAHLRTEQEAMLSVNVDSNKVLEQPQQSASQSNSPNIDKVMKTNHMDKTVLDGATPPVNTIIFENTNFKSAPGARPSRTDKMCASKVDESVLENSVISGFNKPMRDLLNKNDNQADAIQMQLAFSKEDSADMKLDFFESELSHLTDDKTSKNLGLSRSMHSLTSANNTISASTADDALNFKIASVKKVWETMPTVIEHTVGQDDSNSSFSTSFGSDPNALDPSGAFSKGADTPDDTHEGYSPSPNQSASNSTTNVCKVKPTQQIANNSGQTVHITGAHQQHSVVGPGIVGHPLSPPPMQPVIGAGVNLGQPPQQYTSNQHLSYQPNLGGSTQYGMSAIPSPPTVLFNSTQQIQAAQSGMYGAFQIDQQVLGGQGRSQYSQYPNPYGHGQTASSPYSAQSMYLQGAQPHPPPTAQAPPDLYQNMSSYRLPATGPFGQTQQLNNPTTVLISSTSNSLMSATVKPSTQQISAIGTKAGGAGQAYQPQSQQGQQLYMAYDASMQANYLSNTGVIQRGPTGPMQSNVVPTLQPSSSYYTGSTGAQTGYFQQPGSSTLQSASLQQHQAGYGLQGNVFGTPNQSHTSAGLPNFGSHFLSSPIQIAAALNAQQYRSTNLPNTAYMKGIGSQHVGDQSARAQQLKSPGSQQDVLSSVFNTGQQIPSPKSRQNTKPPPQPSPTAQHKYNLYQTVGNQQGGQTQRYPTPIQRPVNFQSAVGSLQGNNGSKHRSTNQNNKMPPRQYYGGQGTNLSTTQIDKSSEDAKLGNNVTSSSSNSAVSNTVNIANKVAITSNSSTVSQATEMTKETTKDETSVKD